MKSACKKKHDSRNNVWSSRCNANASTRASPICTVAIILAIIRGGRTRADAPSSSSCRSPAAPTLIEVNERYWRKNYLSPFNPRSIDPAGHSKDEKFIGPAWPGSARSKLELALGCWVIKGHVHPDEILLCGWLIKIYNRKKKFLRNYRKKLIQNKQIFQLG